MAEDGIILTREGYNKLKEELEVLSGEKRRSISKEIGEARAMGDLSENAEYHAAKEAQAHNEKRVAELENILSRAKILDDSAIDKDTAFLGSIVSILDTKNNEEFDYMLVSEEESDFDSNKISITSLVGKAILGKKAGDMVEIKAPAGVLVYKIRKISR